MQLHSADGIELLRKIESFGRRAADLEDCFLDFPEYAR